MKKIRKVTVHAGHNPSGKIACGASDLLDESTQARYVAICVKCNDVTDADLHISIHFNSGRSDRKGDGRTGGTEVLLTENVADKGDIAKRICNQMAKLGFTNRGVKINKNLYFLNHTKAPAILAEVCFVDDKDDYMLYTSDRDAVAEAIVRAVVKHNKAYIV